MNGNRGQYTSAPLYNMKNRRSTQQMGQPGQQPQQSGAPKRFGVLSLVLCLVLPVLFLLALLIPNVILRSAFLILAVLSVCAMWLFKAFVKNARNTLTIVYAALSIVIGLALVMDMESPEAQRVSNINAQGSLFANTDSSVLSSALASLATPAPTEDASAAVISAAQQRLESFMQYWAMGNVPEMLKLCTPSWISQQKAPENELFQLTVSAKPQSYTVEQLQGSDSDSNRTITLKVMLLNLSGGDAVLNRLHVLMFKVNGVWYVDPQSLGGTPIDEAAELAAQNKPMVGSTVAPTATPAPSTGAGALMVYYNSDGGKYYHSVPNCSAVSEKYWPLDDFYWSDLNSQQFKNLIRCTKCNAPERPSLQ
ncbi:MAG: hypothetical protein E7329_00530 [Clostridiales bacterium]|nr:hypothetical protein [Clostridiales bacterium]